ncbi:hypothetical protein Hanom_Chr00s163469g01826001 [Helianthus anomalus]
MVQIRVRFTRFGLVADSSISSGSGSGEDQSNRVGRFGSWQNFGFGHRVNSVKPGQLSESTRSNLVNSVKWFDDSTREMVKFIAARINNVILYSFRYLHKIELGPNYLATINFFCWYT